MNETMAVIFYVFSVIGLADTLYLSYHTVTKTDVACWFFPKEWCQKVQYSRFSRTLGIPNAYLGLLIPCISLTFRLLCCALFAPGAWFPQSVLQ